MDRAGDEGCVVALDECAQLAGARGRVRLGILCNELELAPSNAAAFVDEPRRRLRRLVVPIAPRCEAAGQLAMMADHDRPARLGIEIAREGEIGSSRGGGARERVR